jgi:hypothetical protein
VTLTNHDMDDYSNEYTFTLIVTDNSTVTNDTDSNDERL